MFVITLIQTSLVWQNREANLLHFQQLLDDINSPTDLIILPEMFTTGFSMLPEQHAESIDGETIKWMQRNAIKKNCAITGSIMFLENGNYFNRLFFVFPDGTYQYYNKRHLFRMGDEHNHYTAGNNRLLINYKGYSIYPLICYDLRFPVWLRRTKSFNYDIMILVANWPKRRNTHWKALLQARAIENQCFVAAVNRVGDDGNNIAHSGDSTLINAKGEIIWQLVDEEKVKTFTINKEETNEYRQLFNVIEDADAFSLNLD